MLYPAIFSRKDRGDMVRKDRKVQKVLFQKHLCVLCVFKTLRTLRETFLLGLSNLKSPQGDSGQTARRVTNTAPVFVPA